MATAEQQNHAKAFLKKAEEYLASAEDNQELERHTPAAGDAIHAGISAKDAIVTALTGTTSKGKDHATAAKELSRALARRPEAATAERALRELIAAKSDVEYGTSLIYPARSELLVKRAHTGRPCRRDRSTRPLAPCPRRACAHRLLVPSVAPQFLTRGARPTSPRQNRPVPAGSRCLLRAGLAG